jgi:transcriptional regulator with XRE-family HTH domain
MMTLGQRIKDFRKKLDISQHELCLRSGVSQVSISRLESDLDKSSTRIGSLAHALQCNALWLQTGEGKPDLDYVAEEGFSKEYSKETKIIIKLLESSDDRGREKALIAVKDALDAHQAWKNSLPRAQETDEINDLSDRLAHDLLPESLDNIERETTSNDGYRAVKAMARKDKHH